MLTPIDDPASQHVPVAGRGGTGLSAPGGSQQSLDAAMAMVRAMHPAWPATLVREVAGRLLGEPLRPSDPPMRTPAALAGALATPASAETFRMTGAPAIAAGDS